MVLQICLFFKTHRTISDLFIFSIIVFCKSLKPKNVDLECYRKSLKVDCDRPMKADITVRPRCKPYHQVEHPVFYRDISCQEDGEWTNPLFSCVSGKKYKMHIYMYTYQNKDLKRRKV